MKKIMGKSWEYHGNIMGISINYIGDDWGGRDDTMFPSPTYG
jgi:hypothetical protein